MGKQKVIKRVLHVFGNVNLGGAESRVMDIYRSMDKSEIQFDFLVHTKEKGFFYKEIKELGGNIYNVPRFKLVNYFSYRKAWKRFFKEHKEFSAIHGHMTSTAAIYLPIAKNNGINITIAHARSAGVDKGIKGILTKKLRKHLSEKTDLCIACSKIAGESVFGKKAVSEGMVIVIPNAINVMKFNYCETTRKQIREKLGIENKWVIGHVGRFHYAKNHEYLIQVFYELLNKTPDSVLLLLGEGENLQQIKNEVERLRISDKVIFMGNQKDIYQYYQAMDYFVFPSRYEGLPGTVVEAQASGLKCMISDTITDEVVCTELAKCKSIRLSPKEWAETIYSEKDYTRQDRSQELIEKGFDVNKQIALYRKIYQVDK